MFVTIRIPAAIGPLVVAGLLLATAIQRPASAADQLLHVTLTSGRSFAGDVDASSSSEALVLRFGKGATSLRRPIRWERIASATHAGEDVPLAEIKELAKQIQTAREKHALPAPSEVNESETTTNVAEPVASITFEARIANWDADVETDGIVLQLFPLNQIGQLTPASGTLEVELFAPQRRAYIAAPQSAGYTTGLIGRWTVPIERNAITENGVFVRLPFQALHPEFQHDLYWYGLVHVKFSVPGSGVFEQSQDAIPLRPFSPLRDGLQQQTGRRFLSTETTSRGKGDARWRP